MFHLSAGMFRALIVTLFVTLVLGAPQFEDDQHQFHEDPEGADAAVIGWSEEETTTKRLNLEDPASWSASTEVMDENHAWFRRRRSVESLVDDAEDVRAGDLEAAESVVFMPAHMRLRRRHEREELRREHELRERYRAWRKYNAIL